MGEGLPNAKVSQLLWLGSQKLRREEDPAIARQDRQGAFDSPGPPISHAAHDPQYLSSREDDVDAAAQDGGHRAIVVGQETHHHGLDAGSAQEVVLKRSEL